MQQHPRPAVLRQCGALRVAALLAAGLLCGCTTTPGGPDGDTTGHHSDLEVPFSATLVCSEARASVAPVERDGIAALVLLVGAERFDLIRTVTASGARYEAVGDPDTFVWFKGTDATLAVRGAMQPTCAVIQPGAPAALRARGNEPSWQLELDQDLHFSAGEMVVQGPLPAAEPGDGFRRHRGVVDARPVDLTVAERVCRDSMSGMPHPLTVELVIDAERFSGCGGAPLDLLTGREWVVLRIDGAMVDDSHATITFGTDGQVSGRASCNRFSASFSLTGETLAIEAGAVTRMACAPALMEQEQRFLDMLQDVRRFDIDATGALLLFDSRERTISARR